MFSSSSSNDYEGQVFDALYAVVDQTIVRLTTEMKVLPPIDQSVIDTTLAVNAKVLMRGCTTTTSLQLSLSSELFSPNVSNAKKPFYTYCM